VYHLCFVRNTEISLDQSENFYFLINYSDGHPSSNKFTFGLRGTEPYYAPAFPPITVNVPASFSYPLTTNSSIDFAPPALEGFTNESVVVQVIPLVGVVQPAHLRSLLKAVLSAKTPPDHWKGIYIGPVHSYSLSYLPHIPFVSFGARLLQTCKTIYAEAIPVLSHPRSML
jgi:hypothetical protein